jgi:hypothetical protein
MIPTPPEGISEGDYEAIEAAVVETVRGRWFLTEYARRNRVDEVRQMLDGLARLEQTVRNQQLPADPSIRLLVQRLKDVSQTLESLAADMRAEGIDEPYCGKVEMQARAVGGLLRGAPQVKIEPPRAAMRPDLKREPRPEPGPAPESFLPAPAAPIVQAPPEPVSRPAPRPVAHTEQGAALTRLDRLPTAEKVALFN